MTRPSSISASIRRTTISLLLLAVALGSSAQERTLSLQRDSVPLLRGFSVSFDMVGAGLMLLSDNGQYEGALRVNLRDTWFPILEVGLGKADHDDTVTRIHYQTSAPYFRIGIDRNLLKQKHGPNRLYGGLRYAFTSYKVDVSRPNVPDPVWLWDTSYGVRDMSCNYHWIEAVVGVDAKIYGPLHLGWSVRYKRRVAHSDGTIGKTWYMPGYGIYGDTRLGGTFNVIIDI